MQILSIFTILREVFRKKTKKGGKRRPQQGRFLRVRTAGIRLLNQCAFVVLVLLGCGAVALLSVPQVKELNRLETELVTLEVEKARALARLDQKTRANTAMREDPEYLEVTARDRNFVYRKGETIIHIKREQDL